MINPKKNYDQSEQKLRSIRTISWMVTNTTWDADPLNCRSTHSHSKSSKSSSSFFSPLQPTLYHHNHHLCMNCSSITNIPLLFCHLLYFPIHYQQHHNPNPNPHHHHIILLLILSSPFLLLLIIIITAILLSLLPPSCFWIQEIRNSCCSSIVRQFIVTFLSEVLMKFCHLVLFWQMPFLWIMTMPMIAFSGLTHACIPYRLVGWLLATQRGNGFNLWFGEWDMSVLCPMFPRIC